VSERSGFLGFMKSPPLQAPEERILFSQGPQTADRELPGFPPQSVASWQFQQCHPPWLAQPPQSLRRFLTDDEVLTLGFPDQAGEVVLVMPERQVPNGGRLF
jgi:hypothetical protein